MTKLFKYKIGDKVFVSDWGKLYSTKFNYDPKTPIFNWNIVFPDNYINQIAYHIKREYTPKLTMKGEPYKDGSQVLVSEYYSYKDYEYEVLDRIIHNDNIIYLLKSKEECIVQIGEKGLTFLSPEEQEKLEKISLSNHIKALAKNNLAKWRITDNLSNFPKELVKTLYDKDQTVLFGGSMSKGIVTYRYIDKMYTVNNVDIIINSSVFYNGEGVDLEGKESMHYKDLHKRFTENRFQ